MLCICSILSHIAPILSEVFDVKLCIFACYSGVRAVNLLYVYEALYWPKLSTCTSGSFLIIFCINVCLCLHALEGRKGVLCESWDEAILL